MFTMDTESGFRDAVFITSSYGLGEAVVQGSVNPDEFYVYKPNIRAKKPAILKRGLGEKAKKLIYSADKTIGKTIEFANVSPEERNRFRSEEHTSELQSLMRISYAVFCLKKTK